MSVETITIYNGPRLRAPIKGDLERQRIFERKVFSLLYLTDKQIADILDTTRLTVLRYISRLCKSHKCETRVALLWKLMSQGWEIDYTYFPGIADGANSCANCGAFVQPNKPAADPNRHPNRHRDKQFIDIEEP